MWRTVQNEDNEALGYGHKIRQQYCTFNHEHALSTGRDVFHVKAFKCSLLVVMLAACDMFTL